LSVISCRLPHFLAYIIEIFPFGMLPLDF